MDCKPDAHDLRPFITVYEQPVCALIIEKSNLKAIFVTRTAATRVSPESQTTLVLLFPLWV